MAEAKRPARSPARRQPVSPTKSEDAHPDQMFVRANANFFRGLPAGQTGWVPRTLGEQALRLGYAEIADPEARR